MFVLEFCFIIEKMVNRKDNWSQFELFPRLDNISPNLRFKTSKIWDLNADSRECQVLNTSWP